MPPAVPAVRLSVRGTATSSSLVLVRPRPTPQAHPHPHPQRFLPLAALRSYETPPRKGRKPQSALLEATLANAGSTRRDVPIEEKQQEGKHPEVIIPVDFVWGERYDAQLRKDEREGKEPEEEEPEDEPKTIHGHIDKIYKEHIWKIGSRDAREVLQDATSEVGIPYGSGKASAADARRLQEDEPDRDLWTGDDESKDTFDEDDILSMAHLKLEEHREYREYSRIIAWEMPLLSTMAKEYERPPRSQQILRFRHTTYLGEYHPAERKVVVEFCPDDIPFEEEWQTLKLKKLAGVRYNPERNIIKMSCESFEHAAQNKRRLGDLVSKMVQEAVDPTDKFEDLPLDLRHHRFKVKPKFPLSWRLSQERAAEINEYRTKTSKLDQQLLDGNKVVLKSFVAGKDKVRTSLPTAGFTPLDAGTGLQAPDETVAAAEAAAVPPEMVPEMVPVGRTPEGPRT